ncbi:MAG: HNH endonuclease [Nitrososphaerales archaeon]
MRTRKLRTARLGPCWTALRRRVLAEEPLCRICGEPAEEVDHVWPLGRGGTSDRQNLQALCRPCHEDKSMGEQPGPLRSPEPSTWVPVWRIARQFGVSAQTVRRGPPIRALVSQRSSGQGIGDTGCGPRWRSGHAGRNVCPANGAGFRFPRRSPSDACTRARDVL